MCKSLVLTICKHGNHHMKVKLERLNECEAHKLTKY
jgi:hypothetical protein